MENKEKIFVDGVYAQKRENSPAFVVSSLSIKVPDFIPFLEKHQNNAGYVNFDILLSQKGTQYCQLNTFKPSKDNAKVEQDNQEELNNLEKEPIIDPISGVDCSEIPF